MESPLLFFSPTVNYASQPQFAPGRRFTDKVALLSPELTLLWPELD